LGLPAETGARRKRRPAARRQQTQQVPAKVSPTHAFADLFLAASGDQKDRRAFVGGDFRGHNVGALAGLAHDIKWRVEDDGLFGKPPPMVGIGNRAGRSFAVVKRVAAPAGL
jgi:hypothetical protein